MTTKKMFSVISIACFVSVIFIPIGIVLMFFYTDWKKKVKIITSAALTAIYIILAIFVLTFNPSQNKGQINLSIPITSENSAAYTSTNKKIENQDDFDFEEESEKNSDIEQTQNQKQEKIPKRVSRSNNFLKSRVFYIIMFFFFMLFLVIHQNLKNSKKKQEYENPYVDTNKYKLPLSTTSDFPMVHFHRLKISNGEKILYASETTKKDDEGDFIVTNKRVVVLSKNGDYEFPLPAITAVSSVSNSVMLLTCGERKYYIFFPEGQVKYALAVIRWAYSNQNN